MDIWTASSDRDYADYCGNHADTVRFDEEEPPEPEFDEDDMTPERAEYLQEWADYRKDMERDALMEYDREIETLDSDPEWLEHIAKFAA